MKLWHCILLLAAAFSAVLLIRQQSVEESGPGFDPLAQLASGLPDLMPQLEAESSPYFSRRQKALKHGRVEILEFRSDWSQAHLHYSAAAKLTLVEVYSGKEAGRRLSYRATYAEDGRRIQKAEYFGKDSRLESMKELQADGSELWSFYRAAALIRKVQVFSDGSSCTEDFGPDGDLKSRLCRQAELLVRDLEFWDKEKSKPRLSCTFAGGRLQSCRYFNPQLVLEHEALVLPDGSIEFSYLKPDGQLHLKQLWRFQGEDWERAYYGLAYSELYASDGKQVEHRVWQRANGTLLKHERLNAKTGKLEMERSFDQEGRVDHVRDFNQNGEKTRDWYAPPGSPRARGFVPTGMRAYPGGDEKSGYVYDLDGMPFHRALSERRQWQFICQPGL